MCAAPALSRVALGAGQGWGPPGGGPIAGSVHASEREVLRGPLWQLSSSRLPANDRQRLGDGLITGGQTAGFPIAVSVELSASATGPVVNAVASTGARVVNVAGATIEAYVAPDRLAALAGLDAVQAIRPITRHSAAGVVSPSTLHGSDAWQAAGLTGAGVKVGIIDGGFAGMGERLGKGLPVAVHARCYTAVGSFTTKLADCANGETHGTAVAESIYDMAPGVELYVADPISRLDEQRAVAWMTGSGVQIINASFLSGLLFDGPGDGTSPYRDSLYALVDQAVAGGALWVNAAGNGGDSGWTGAWTDADSDGLLDFAPGVSADAMTLVAGDDVTVAIRWADPWGASANDYDLELYAGSKLVGSSTDVQAGAGDPVEVIEYRAPTAGRYEVRIRRVSGAPTARMQLLVGTGEDVKLAYQVADGTLPTPADSLNPGMLAVGAVKLEEPNEIEPYSSRGPTLDGRAKPDLVAVDCAPTGIESPFCGTSQAAPFVAGAAAQVLQARPRLDPVQLAAWLRSRAVQLGSPVPNSTFGAGRLDLGALPFSPAAGLAFQLPPTGAVAGAALTGQPVVALLDSSGLVVGTGPDSTAGVAISLQANPAGATISCTGGLTRNAKAGVATFGGCAVDRPGSGYMIRAEAEGLPAATSVPFDILAVGSALPLTLTASPRTLTLGGTAALSARFEPTPLTSDRPIEVERSVDGLSWARSEGGTTSATGTLVVSVRPTASGWYRVRFAGSADLAAATSYPVGVTVRASIALAASVHPPHVIASGTAVTFTSTVRPADAGLPRTTVTFLVARRVGAVWATYRSLSVVADATGRARLTWRFSIPGSWYVRSWAHATSANGSSAWSAVARYDVR
jgi:hypothetical protein